MPQKNVPQIWLFPKFPRMTIKISIEQIMREI